MFERCPSNGEGPEHAEIAGGGKPFCEICAILWAINNDVVDWPTPAEVDALERGPDGIYRPKPSSPVPRR